MHRALISEVIEAPLWVNEMGQQVNTCAANSDALHSHGRRRDKLSSSGHLFSVV